MSEKIITKPNKSKGLKKNISIFKKDKTIKIKPICKSISQEKLNSQEKSMDMAIKDNEVLLWGLNKIDSILLGLSDPHKNYNKFDNKLNFSLDKDIHEIQTNKTKDKEYNPDNKYNLFDLDFLNMEYDRIDKKISELTDLTDEYDNLLDLQDKLTDLINELEYEAKNNIQINSDTNKENLTKPDTTKKKKISKKLKPYFWIGEIPDGYREATEEESIINKKVSYFGKKRVQRELYSLFEITGTIYIDYDDPIKLNQQIIGLKGKLKYYKRELEFNKISLDSDTISSDNEIKIKNKIKEINNCYKKTCDILNLYINKYNQIK
jgi:hypothetical protein